MTEREKVLLRREGAVAAMMLLRSEWCTADANTEAAMMFPLPSRTRTVLTVRQGVADRGKWWYRVKPLDLSNGLIHSVYRFNSYRDAVAGFAEFMSLSWPPEDQPTIAALLALPLNEEVEDTGE